MRTRRAASAAHVGVQCNASHIPLRHCEHCKATQTPAHTINGRSHRTCPATLTPWICQPQSSRACRVPASASVGCRSAASTMAARRATVPQRRVGIGLWLPGKEGCLPPWRTAKRMKWLTPLHLALGATPVAIHTMNVRTVSRRRWRRLTARCLAAVSCHVQGALCTLTMPLGPTRVHCCCRRRTRDVLKRNDRRERSAAALCQRAGCLEHIIQVDWAGGCFELSPRLCGEQARTLGAANRCASCRGRGVVAIMTYGSKPLSAWPPVPRVACTPRQEAPSTRSSSFSCAHRCCSACAAQQIPPAQARGCCRMPNTRTAARHQPPSTQPRTVSES